MSHLSINPVMDQQGHSLTQLVVPTWPNMRNLLDTMVAGADDLRGLVEPVIISVNTTIASGAVVVSQVFIDEGLVAVAYKHGRYAVDITSPLINTMIFNDNRLLTPRGFPYTRSTGIIEFTGMEGARRNLQLLTTNNAAFDITIQIQIPVLHMTDYFYDRVYRPLKRQAMRHMMELAEKLGGGL